MIFMYLKEAMFMILKLLFKIFWEIWDKVALKFLILDTHLC